MHACMHACVCICAHYLYIHAGSHASLYADVQVYVHTSIKCVAACGGAVYGTGVCRSTVSMCTQLTSTSTMTNFALTLSAGGLPAHSLSTQNMLSEFAAHNRYISVLLTEYIPAGTPPTAALPKSVEVASFRGRCTPCHKCPSYIHIYILGHVMLDSNIPQNEVSQEIFPPKMRVCPQK